VLTRLSLISHAATRAQRLSAFPSDEPVDESAISKVVGSGKLPPADHVWSAPERRTQQTAHALGLSAEVEAELRDCDYGTWSGRQLNEIQLEDPEGLLTWLTDASSAPHGGESLLNLTERIAIWLGQQRSPGHVIAVTHPAVIRSAIIHVLRVPAESFWRVDIEPLSLTDLRFNGNTWTIRSAGSQISQILSR
jgi:broad specificity phosphatase PhoE